MSRGRPKETTYKRCQPLAIVNGEPRTMFISIKIAAEVLNVAATTLRRACTHRRKIKEFEDVTWMWASEYEKENNCFFEGNPESMIELGSPEDRRPMQKRRTKKEMQETKRTYQ